MNLNEIDLNLLLVFEAVYVERNLTEAGRRLNITQPAVSNALKRLRDRVEDPLFIRSTDGMLPTPYAQKIYPIVTQSLSSLRHCFTHEREFDPANIEHAFRIMVSDYNSAIILPKLMKHLNQNAKDISIINSQMDRLHAYEIVKEGRADFVITDKLDGPNLYQQKLYSDHYVTLVRKDHPIIKDKLSLDDFCNIPHILFSLEGQGVSNVDQALAEISRSRHIALRLPHISSIPQILQETNYLVNMPSRVAKPLTQNYDLKIMQPPIALEDYTVHQFWHKRSHQDPACMWLRSVFKGLNYET